MTFAVLSSEPRARGHLLVHAATAHVNLGQRQMTAPATRSATIDHGASTETPMRCAAIVLGVTLAASTAAADTPRLFVFDNPHRHVRPTSLAGRELIQTGMAQSATFRRLVHRIEASDVIVYVQLEPGLPTGVGGVLEFMAAGGDVRFLRISLGRQFQRPILVALLGHELQHAVEVADAPGVRSATQLEALYRSIGHPVGRHRYDSVAARFAGQTVRDELTGRAVNARVARKAGHDDVLLEGGSIAMP